MCLLTKFQVRHSPFQVHLKSQIKTRVSVRSSQKLVASRIELLFKDEDRNLMYIMGLYSYNHGSMGKRQL